MKIRGIFCATTATTNEEYRKVLKKRNIWMMALVLSGALIAGMSLYMGGFEEKALPEYSIGIYVGFGVGLALAGILLLVKNLVLMGNEEKLKTSRLENADERLSEISSKACRIVLMVMLLTIIAGGMIGSMFEPILAKAMLVLIDVFALSYIAAFCYYKRKC